MEHTHIPTEKRPGVSSIERTVHCDEMHSVPVYIIKISSYSRNERNIQHRNET